MFPLPSASTANMSLDQVLARLSAHPLVDGLLTIGSTKQAQFNPVSDYDIVLILSSAPVPLHVGITFIDHRLTDLLFVTSAQIEQVLNAETPIPGDTWNGRIARWLLDGQILFDRHGQVQQAQAKIAQGGWIQPLNPIDSYGAWIGVNYNLIHTRRLLQSDDPVYRHAAELRMSLYGVMSLLLSYFRVRQCYWEGDKAAIRHLLTHDPAYFDLLQRFLREADPDTKFAYYEQLARLTMAPLGDLWSGEPVVLWNDPADTTLPQITTALTFWEELIRHPA